MYIASRGDDEIKTIWCACIKQTGGLRRQMKFQRPARILSRWPVVWKLTWWRAVKTLSVSFQPAWWRRTKRIGQYSNPTMQFIINATDQSSAFQLIRRETEARQHDHEDEAIPDLQPPFDGFGNHDDGNIQHSTFNAQH